MKLHSLGKVILIIIEGNIKAQFLYGSPESIVGDIKFKEMSSHLHYRQNVAAIVCDEVQVFRGEKRDEKGPFRKWCGLVGDRSFLPKQVPFLALTATASPSTHHLGSKLCLTNYSGKSILTYM